MDNKLKTGKRDDSKININESYEVQYWTQKLNVTKEQLRDAVQSVGVQVKNVEEFLRNKK